MTKEEAICELSVIWERLSHPEDCENGCYSFRDGNYTEALDMAIEALSEPSGDLISRADVFEIIDKAFSQPMRNGATLYADICLMLNALSTHANSRSTHERVLISRADAIEAVQNLMANEDEWYQEAFSKALKALTSAEYSKPLQTTLNGDLISKADAIKAIRKCKFESDMPSHWYRAIGIQKWKCDHNCERCICGMKMNGKAEWEHNHGVQE